MRLASCLIKSSILSASLLKNRPIFYTWYPESNRDNGIREAFIKSKFLTTVYIYNKIYSIIGYNNGNFPEFSDYPEDEHMYNNKISHTNKTDGTIDIYVAFNE
jgi:hypothetical protein